MVFIVTSVYIHLRRRRSRGQPKDAIDQHTMFVADPVRDSTLISVYPNSEDVQVSDIATAGSDNPVTRPNSLQAPRIQATERQEKGHTFSGTTYDESMPTSTSSSCLC